MGPTVGGESFCYRWDQLGVDKLLFFTFDDEIGCILSLNLLLLDLRLLSGRWLGGF